MNEDSVSDYIDMQCLMFTLNTHYRDNPFQVFSPTRLFADFRKNICIGFGAFVRKQKKSVEK